MITVRKAADRGQFNHGWLKTAHTFSFARYYDPAQMGFRALRVINEDVVAPGQGFGMHGHEDMEIVTYVLSGALAHRDSLGHGEVLKAGELQRMTAGTGIRHSEFNSSATEAVHLYQIWLLPEREGLPPSYEQRAFPASERQDRWQTVAAPNGRDGALTIHQDAVISLAELSPQKQLDYDLTTGRHAWVQVTRGKLSLNDVDLSAGDGAAVSDEPKLRFKAPELTETMLFDLA
jgi:redox-sensitive bicupin YhaK (pirin superfamily)